MPALFRAADLYAADLYQDASGCYQSVGRQRAIERAIDGIARIPYIGPAIGPATCEQIGGASEH